MNWDAEVDVVCTGAGVGGLASAIAAVESDLEVFVASPTSDGGAGRSLVSVDPGGGPQRCWWGLGIDDPMTTGYLAALSEGLRPLTRGGVVAEVPVRVVDSAPVPPAQGAETFYGSRLRDWAARCLTSPYGVLHTRVADRPATVLRTREGEVIEAWAVGSLESGDVSSNASLLSDWITAQAVRRGVEVSTESPLQRIVFDDDGRPIGAVFARPEGSFAVRARRGVTVASGNDRIDMRPLPAVLDTHAQLQVCLVSRTASRFGRIEVLTTNPLPTRPLAGCRATNRQMFDNLHGTALAHSRLRRCRKFHRYPSTDQ